LFPSLSPYEHFLLAIPHSHPPHPSEGLAPLIVQELLQTLVSLRDTGMTIGVG
jgi:hypothetical protein